MRSAARGWASAGRRSPVLDRDSVCKTWSLNRRRRWLQENDAERVFREDAAITGHGTARIIRAGPGNFPPLARFTFAMVGPGSEGWTAWSCVRRVRMAERPYGVSRPTRRGGSGLTVRRSRSRLGAPGCKDVIEAGVEHLIRIPFPRRPPGSPPAPSSSPSRACARAHRRSRCSAPCPWPARRRGGRRGSAAWR